MKVAIAWSCQRDTPDTDLRPTVEALAGALRALGREPVSVPLGLDAAAFLRDIAAAGADVVWNLCEEASGRPGRELHAAALVELGDLPVTGTSAAALALCLDKVVCRAVLAAAGVQLAAAVCMRDLDGPLPDALPLPAIVKPACQDGSVGIDRGSVCYSRSEVAAALARLEAADLLPALVEQYIDGREVSLLMLGPAAGPIHHWAFGEIDLSSVPDGEPRILTYAGKWQPDSAEYLRTPSHYPASIEPALGERLREAGARAFSALGLAGYARVDFRIAADGQCFAIDVNGNPDISPDAGLQRALPTLGLTFAEFVDLQLGWARVR